MRRISLLVLLFLVIFALPTVVSADSGDKDVSGDSALVADFNTESLYDALSEETKDTLSRMGVDTPDSDVMDSVSVSAVFSEIIRLISSQSKDVISFSAVLIGVMLLYSVVKGMGTSFSSVSTQEVLSVISALSVACILAVPLCNIISMSENIIRMSSDFMLAYIPVMVSVLMACGKTVSGAGYYSLMIFYAEFIARVSSSVIVPCLNVFLGISVSSSLVPEIKLNGILSLFSKSIKWILSFTFTMFTALLSFKTLISASVDNVSTRAVRYTMSSFVPVIGAALSEAYRTVNASFRLLRSGVGVFAIFAVFTMFLPILVKLVLWMFSLGILKNLSATLDLTVPCEMFFAISTVMSVLLAVIICIAALYIISTALIITAGGSA